MKTNSSHPAFCQGWNLQDAIVEKDPTMTDENFNMSMRKFLKQVGVTSQQEIERIVREGGGGGQSLTVKMVLTAEGTDLNHVVTGQIDLG